MNLDDGGEAQGLRLGCECANVNKGDGRADGDNEARARRGRTGEILYLVLYVRACASRRGGGTRTGYVDARRLYEGLRSAPRTLGAMS